MNKINSTVTRQQFVFLVLSLLIASVSFSAQATSLNHLVKEGELVVNVDIENKNVALKQQVVLDVEVLSRRSFREDLVLPYLDIPNTVVKKDEQKVTRSARPVEGEKWFTQKARYYLYPMQGGEFTVPALSIPVGVESESDQVLKGSVLSKPVTFTAKETVTNVDTQRLVVSPNAEFSMSTDRPLSEEFEIGHAITVTYALSVEDSHMMLLPEIELPEISGVEQYRKPPVKENVFNRLNKSNTASLKQQVTVVLQQQGKVVLPKQTVTWWNTKSSQLESLTVEAQTIQVGGATLLDSIRANSGLQTLYNVLKFYGLYVLIVVIFIVAIVRLLVKHSDDLKEYLAARKKLNNRKLGSQFCRNIQNHDYKKAVQDLYVIAGRNKRSNATFQPTLDPQAQRIWNRLLALAYSEDSFGEMAESDAKILLNAVKNSPKNLFQKKASSFVFNWRLN